MHLGELPVYARVADKDRVSGPPGWQIVAQRGPFLLDDELDTMEKQQIDVLISKDSGGADTAAKLEAANLLGVTVIMISRPPPAPGVPGCATVEGVLSWLDGVSSGPEQR